MPTSDDARDAMSAILNQIPPTMEATQVALNYFAALVSVRDDTTEAGLKKLDQLLAKLVPTFTACITTLENRLERLEGRPGVSLDALRNIMSEFTAGGA
jgi:hypothetical protein